jgi:hypothetical protein
VDTPIVALASYLEGGLVIVNESAFELAVKAPRWF